uniref:Uncharacterized protein n=1 Tax=Magnetococcus massalia (strain MO-1) TaxID=451514 RepID=A0A1S7LG40_MAGMO|nr:protein of unknown function [Candidatus Magnetococcus massalia]
MSIPIQIMAQQLRLTDHSMGQRTYRFFCFIIIECLTKQVIYWHDVQRCLSAPINKSNRLYCD